MGYRTTRRQLKVQPSYPEHEKLKDLAGANQIVGDFIEWLYANGMWIAQYAERSDQLIPSAKNRDELLADHFGIDRKRLEDEKQSMLDALRKQTGVA